MPGSEIFSDSINESHLSLNKLAEYFLDAECQYQNSDFLEGQKTIDFKKTLGKKINLGIQSGNLWVKFQLSNTRETAREKIIEIDPPFLDRVEMFQVINGKVIEHSVTGDTIPITEKQFQSRSILFKVVFPPKSESLLYLKVHTKNLMLFSANLWEMDAKLSSFYVEDSIIYIFYGVILIIGVYNFFLYFAFKNISFIYFAFYSFSAGLNQLCIDGSISLISNFPELNNRLHMFSTILIICFGVMFLQNFLNIKEFFPKWIPLLNGFVGFNILLGIYVWVGSISISDTAGNISAMFVSFLALILSVASIQKGNVSAWYYFFGYIFVLFSFILYMLEIYNFLPMISIHVMKFGFGSEMCLFSLGLSERIRQVQLDKVKAQKDLILTQERARENLEQKVKDRTKELDSVLTELRNDLNTAKKIQENLLPNKILESGGLSIFSEYLPLSEIGGDIYDIYQMSDKKTRIFLADATGHGIQAALFTMLIIGEYELHKKKMDYPEEVLLKLNERFTTTYSGLNAFFTCCILEIDLENQLISFSSAGHPPQTMFNPTMKNFKSLTTSGKMIGISRKSQYSRLDLKANPGDYYLLFTDGATEIFNSASMQFGEFRLMRNFIRACNSKEDPKGILRNILQSLAQFKAGAKFQDDVTLVVAELKKF